MEFMQDTILTPSIFEGVDRVKSVFTLAGELTDQDPLGNNMSVVDSVVRDGLKLVGVPDDQLDKAVAREVERALLRRTDLIHSVGLLPDATSSPKPVQGADVVDVSRRTIADLLLDSPTRRSADAATIVVPGYANLIAPADCPVYDIVDPRSGGQVAQGHAGWQGILAGAVVALLERLIRRGLNPGHALVNIHPNATDGFELQGEGLEKWLATFGGDFVKVIDERSFIDMTGAVVAQMEDAGFRTGQIQTSSAYSHDGKDLNSLTDDRFYSHRAKAQKGFNGRNAAILVRVGD